MNRVLRLAAAVFLMVGVLASRAVAWDDQRPEKLPSGYEKEARKVARQRVALAGCRMADALKGVQSGH